MGWLTYIMLLIRLYIIIIYGTYLSYNWKFIPFGHLPPNIPRPSSVNLKSDIFLYEFLVFCFLDSTYKGDHIVLVYLAYFTYSNAFKVHLCCCKWWEFQHVLWLNNAPFCVYVCIHMCVYIYVCTHMHTYISPQLLYSFIHWWTLTSLSCLGYYK